MSINELGLNYLYLADSNNILSKIKIYSARMLLKVVQSKSYLILLNLSVTA